MYETQSQRLREMRHDLERFMAIRKGNPDKPGPQMMSVPDIAAFIGCQPRTIRSAVESCVSGVETNKGRYRYPIRNVAKWLVQRQTIQPLQTLAEDVRRPLQIGDEHACR